ncbi:shoot gravitropism 2 (SGR2) [Artemisia annua]|uniref:Shoot gravitropism 2 (SGR2) n=1 Tax=Artemisia annua TaxID=35608 RepID=A0A2U1QF89_ARTAN|nr:shoot gravitropism 2 (SGR2) [Artemisia annua]
MAESSGKGEEGRRSAADMLRNTPSNIRRLIDEIQHYEGRQKYLAQTRSPSDGGDVRWYFSKVPMAENELAAALPLTEVVGKGDYFRFGMRDSLAIEASFLQREEELLSNWWREYGECSIGPKGSLPSISESDPMSYDLATTRNKLYSDEEERVGVPVKGGLYEVDLLRRHSFPVYWNGDNRRVLRGHWFARKGSLDWFPLREDVAEQLEFAYRSRVWHRRTFQPSGLFAARVDMQGSTPGLHAIFTGEDDTWDAWLNIPSSGFSGIVHFGGTGIKLRRGYAPSQSPKPTQDELRQQKEEEMDDYCSQVPVRHLVFMVHGIGQRLQKANLVDDVGTFRQLTQNLADKHLTSYQRETQRVLFIPCQWRKDLKLSGESAVEKCTLPGVRGLRVTLSATVHDVLYYMSPIYCQDIIDSVSNQLNRLYLKFLKRNPGYDGKVSLYGHSLGSVLSFDILCHQDTLASPFPMEWMYKDHNNEIAPERDSFNYMENDSVTNKVGMDTLASTSDRNLSAATEIEKQDSPDLDEVGVKSVDSPIDMHSEKISSLDECSGVNSEVVMSNFNEIEEETVKNDESTNIDEETDKNDENLVIKSLKEEIDSLNAKIKELESQRAEENKQEASVTRNGSVSESSPSSKNESMKSYTPVIKYTKLMFKVDTFFAVGSPLGVFLALRNVRIGIGKGKDYWEDENIIEEMPCCRQMFNIFHPYDPVAYRVEPLVCKEYLDKRAVIIPYHRGGKRLHVGYREFVEKVESRSQVVVDQMSVAKVKVLTLCQSRESDDHEESSEESEEIERSYGLLMLERLTGSQDGRVDHVLQNKTFEHQYISAVGAHTKYWRDPDTALFILKHLYRDIPNAPYIPNKHSENATNQENHDWKELFDDEELPLTFASEDFLKQFSVGVKKFTNK